jgi:hypothetical protein
VQVAAANGTLSNAVGFLSTDTPPDLVQLLPASVGEGADGLSLSISGSGFKPGARLLFGADSLPVVFENATRLTAAVPPALIDRQGSISVAVRNPDGGTSNSMTFTVTPRPLITRLAPTAITAGSPDSVIKVQGLSFQPGVAARLDDAGLAVRFVGETELELTLPAVLLTTPGTRRLLLQNPDGGKSNVAVIEIK